jgi:polysaccharide pyruvyl transferase WcaK-like protein
MRILLFYHGGSKNRGCEAIIFSAIPILRKQFPDAIINLASLDYRSDVNFTDIENIYDVSTVAIKEKSLDYYISALYLKFKKDDSYAIRKQNYKMIELIDSHDVFLSVGGDNYCYGEQPSIYEIDRNIKKAGKKLILWGASIGQEDLSETKINDLKSFDLILARESITLETLKNNGINNVELCADGAFIMDKLDMRIPTGWQDNNVIGFNYSPLIYKRNKESEKAATDLLQHIIDTTEFKICLVPHVMIPDNNDYEALLRFYLKFKETQRIIFLPNNVNAKQYKGFIAKMRMFIGARTHTTIAAYSNFVPTMVLGYSIKSKGIAKDIFGYEKLVLGIEEISDSKKLIEKFEELKREENEIREILKNKIPHIQQMAFKAGEILADYLKR